MTDEFLIKFALSTLAVMSFSFQHLSQIIYRRITKDQPKDKQVSLWFLIIVMQLASISIVIEMMEYALTK